MGKRNEITNEEHVPYSKLTLANNFMFYKVMRHHPDACKHLLEMLLNIKFQEIISLCR